MRLSSFQDSNECNYQVSLYRRYIVIVGNMISASDIPPDVVTYSAMISASDILPDMITYNAR